MSIKRKFKFKESDIYKKGNHFIFSIPNVENTESDFVFSHFTPNNQIAVFISNSFKQLCGDNAFPIQVSADEIYDNKSALMYDGKYINADDLEEV